MDIVVRGRRTDVPERFRSHAVDRLSRLARFDAKLIRLDVEVSHEPNPRLEKRCERVELTCVSRGPVVRAEASAGDSYEALDLACAKLERRLRSAADRRRVHHGLRTPVGLAEAAAAAAPDRAGPAAAASPGHDVDGYEADASALVVREKDHAAGPMSIDQALHEMELVGHDFFLFRDADSGRPSVVYRRRGYAYGLLRLVE